MMQCSVNINSISIRASTQSARYNSFQSCSFWCKRLCIFLYFSDCCWLNHYVCLSSRYAWIIYLFHEQPSYSLKQHCRSSWLIWDFKKADRGRSCPERTPSFFGDYLSSLSDYWNKHARLLCCVIKETFLQGHLNKSTPYIRQMCLVLHKCFQEINVTRQQFCQLCCGWNLTLAVTAVEFQFTVRTPKCMLCQWSMLSRLCAWKIKRINHTLHKSKGNYSWCLLMFLLLCPSMMVDDYQYWSL